MGLVDSSGTYLSFCAEQMSIGFSFASWESWVAVTGISSLYNWEGSPERVFYYMLLFLQYKNENR